MRVKEGEVTQNPSGGVGVSRLSSSPPRLSESRSAAEPEKPESADDRLIEKFTSLFHLFSSPVVHV